MNRFTRNYLTGLGLYIILAEAFFYCGTHGISVDSFIQINAVILLCVGGFALFICGLIGWLEGLFG